MAKPHFGEVRPSQQPGASKHLQPQSTTYFLQHYVMCIAVQVPFCLQAIKAASARGKWCHMQSGPHLWACVHLLSPLCKVLP